MKVIQDRELDRICSMINGDKEMGNLAIKILKNKERMRFNYSLIILFHGILFISSLTVVVYLHYRYTLGLYIIPALTAVLLQGLFSSIHLVAIANCRKRYNQELKDLREK